MLDNETKRRIDTARDILVGKIPDPKSQVEQITIALIYKFMDDMDRQAENLPRGKAKFFTGEYKKYAWRNIFNPSNSGQEIVNLYGEALQNMNYNENVPQLFRDIFKNAYLPYRDPETLKDFLKEINHFEYDHSERLGDAFEYLLSVLGSQGDAGQFRTPRNIIDFMVEIIEPKKNDKILDPACGTGGFLISAYKHIQKRNSKNYDPKNDPKPFELQDIKLSEITINGKGYRGEKLTSDDRKRLVENITGYDISPDMVRLSLVNMYLHGFSSPHISEYDTLSRDDKWDEKADVILANPPFMSPKGGIKPHSKFRLAQLTKRSEVLFVDYMAEHLLPNGRAAIIVPEGIIFQTGSAYKALRKMLVDEKFLVGVISLPAGLFNPYSGVKTSIIWLDKTLAKKTDKILFVKIENDGFDLGAQRRPIKKNDLPDAYQAIMEYKRCLTENDDFILEGWQNVSLVERGKIAKDKEYNLNGEKYIENKSYLNIKHPLVELKDYVELVRGVTYSKKDEVEKNGYEVLRANNISLSGQIILEEIKHVSKQVNFKEKQKLHKEDVFICLASGSKTHIGKVAYIEHDMPYYFGGFMGAIRSNKKSFIPKYLFYLLNSDKFNEYLGQAISGANINNLNSKILYSYKVPLPPLSSQQEIVTELDSYQKIIDGARQVVENYKPHIDIDSEWKVLKLGEVVEINPKKSQVASLDHDTEVSFVPMSDINENRMSFQPQTIKRIGEVFKGYTYFAEDDVLLAKVTPCFENGKAGLARGLKNKIGFGSSEFYVLRAGQQIRPEWIYYNIISSPFRESGIVKMTGTGGLQRVPKDFVANWIIPCPHLNIQDEIIQQIEKEQNTILSNRKLIETYEQKIKDRIARIWGEK